MPSSQGRTPNPTRSYFRSAGKPLVDQHEVGWVEAADLILNGLNGAIGSKKVTYDFARLMEGATEIKCSAFGDNIIAHM